MKKERIVIVGLLFVLLAVYIFELDNSPVFRGDQVTYMLLGKSIADGNGLRDIWTPENSPHTKFPFMYPLFLSGIIHFFGFNFLYMRLVNFAFLLGALVVLYFWFKSRCDFYTTMGILFLTGIYTGIMYCVFRITSELAFLFFSSLSLLCLEKYEVKKQVFSRPAVLSVIFMTCAFFSRIIGVVLIAAAILYFLGKRRYGKSFFLVLTMLIPVGWWLLRSLQVKVYYLEFLSFPNFNSNFEINWGLLQTLIKNFYSYLFYTFPHIVTNILFSHRFIPVLAIFPIVALGLRKKLLNSGSVAEYYSLIYLVFLLFFSSSSFNRRYFVPVVPWVIYYFFEGITVFNPPLRLKYFIVIVICVVSLRMSVVYAAQREYLNYSQKQISDFMAMAQWVKTNTKPEDCFLTHSTGDVFLHFERKSYGFLIPPRRLIAEQIDFICRHKVDYVLESSLFDPALNPLSVGALLESNSGRVKLVEVYRLNNDNAVFQVIKRGQ
jgi:hypothetical protein